MVNYRRALVPGATDFFTVTLRDRRKRYLLDHADVLRAVVRDVRRQRPFAIDALVVLPDHLHALWTLPAGDADFPGRWRAIKGVSPAPSNAKAYCSSVTGPVNTTCGSGGIGSIGSATMAISPATSITSMPTR